MVSGFAITKERNMNAEEDAANAIHNEIMRECSHDPYLTPSGGIECRSCGGHFALVLKPRLAKVIPLVVDDGSEP